LSELDGFPVVFSIAVQWGEQDAFGHVNNVVYFRWCETARIYYLERIGLFEMLEKERIGPIVASIGCNYRQPVTFPDTMHIGAAVSKIGKSSFKMDHKLVTEKLGHVADAESTLVVYDYTLNKPHPVPDHIRAAIARIEGREL
jgi:acyl-CoA thioester hydrolase